MDQADAYTISEFCQRNRISRAFYYKLKEDSLTPNEMRLGSKILISKESAAEWRRQRDAAAQPAAA